MREADSQMAFEKFCLKLVITFCSTFQTLIQCRVLLISSVDRSIIYYLGQV